MGLKYYLRVIAYQSLKKSPVQKRYTHTKQPTDTYLNYLFETLNIDFGTWTTLVELNLGTNQVSKLNGEGYKYIFIYFRYSNS